MAAIPTARIVRPSLNSIASDIIFPFLAPSVHSAKYAPYTPVARFSTSPALWKRDNNKNRGVSALRHTGPRKRQTLSVSKYIDDLPKPVEPEEAVAGDANHGLWGFFHEKKLLRTPVQESSHGMVDRASL
jgi:large subunit ribosomal protein L47